MKSLKNSIALAFINGVLYIAEYSHNRIRCLDMTGETILRLEDLNISQLNTSLETLGVKGCNTKGLSKASLKSKLKSELDKKHTVVSGEKTASTWICLVILSILVPCCSWMSTISSFQTWVDWHFSYLSLITL